MDNGSQIPRSRLLLCALVQWTWGALQNLLGLFVYLVCFRKPHGRYRTAVVTLWDRPDSLSCGMFVFLSNHNSNGSQDAKIKHYQRKILLHEYGHTLQSLMLGPLFLIVIGLPSFIWAALPIFDRLRDRKNLSYYWLYCEKWATHLGEKIPRTVPTLRETNI